MARIEVVMPQMGESIAEGTIVKWHKKVGDPVKKDETLLEISTDKVDSEIPSPASGVLSEITVKENETVAVRSVIAYLDTEGAPEAARPREAPPAPPKPQEAPAAEQPKRAEPARKAEPLERKEEVRRPAPAPSKVEPVAAPAAAPGEGDIRPGPKDGRFFSPLVMNIAHSEGVSMDELQRIQGTGEAGRVTKKDILAFVQNRKESLPPPQKPAPQEYAQPAGAASATPRPSREGRTAAAPSLSALARPSDDAELRQRYPAPQHEVLHMSNVLQRMAQHMVQSMQTSPHVGAIHEVDMTAVVRHRQRFAAEFERREGFKLTYTPYVIDAVVKALKKYPLVNSSVEGDNIIKKNYINLGVAVASENGLIVPVIKHAEEKNFLGYARAVQDLATRTRQKKLVPDEIQGGTFTITNYGVFGTIIGTPIINQPQVAILGTGAITKRVAVTEDDAIAIRSLAYFTLSFDHRIIDGATGGLFLAEVERTLEEFDEGMEI